MKHANVLAVLVISLFLLLASKASATDVVCFEELEAGRIVMDIEKGHNAEEQVELYKQANAELEHQVKLLGEVSQIQKQQLDIAKDTVKQYQELIKFQKESYESAIKESKPSFLQELFKNFGFVGIGILVGVLL